MLDSRKTEQSGVLTVPLGTAESLLGSCKQVRERAWLAKAALDTLCTKQCSNQLPPIPTARAFMWHPGELTQRVHWAGHLQNKQPSSKLITNDILYNYKQPQTLKVEAFGHFQMGFKS